MSDTEIVQNEPVDEVSDEDTSRKLVIVTRIKKVRPIAGADKIEIATFTSNGWQCVVGKDEFRIGDKAVFFEIDSFLPKEERYSVLDGRSNKVMNGKEGFRIKSMKMRGEISQGFAMPLYQFPEIFGLTEYTLGDGTCLDLTVDGVDVTKILNVKLWQLPIAGGFGFNIGRQKGGFPTHLVRKTDQERIQSMGRKDILDFFGYDLEVTEKLDGTSCTLYGHFVDLDYGQFAFKFGVCSRNMELKPAGLETIEYSRPLENGEIEEETDIVLPDGSRRRKCTKTQMVSSVYWDMAVKYAVENRLREWCETNKRSIALQGEVCGPGIQKNPCKLDEIQMFVFDIYNIDTQHYVTASERTRIIEELNAIELTPGIDADPIQHVPVIEYTKITPALIDLEYALTKMRVKEWNEPCWHEFLGAMIDNISRQLIAKADGPGKIGGKRREGLVFKSLQNPDKSFKVISNEYLLKNEE